MEAIVGKTQYRVIYGDTDQMGVVYYGNYGRFYEMGRSEMIRELGFPYAELEEMGVVMPVYSVEAKYRKVITYDELITIETTVKEMPTAKMKFHHRIFNEDGTLAHEATVVLVFMDMETKKLTRAPRVLLDVIK
jgi:acyl-CoA thioester hydrolase